MCRGFVLLNKPIACLMFSLPSPSYFRKVPNIGLARPRLRSQRSLWKLTRPSFLSRVNAWHFLISRRRGGQSGQQNGVTKVFKHGQKSLSPSLILTVWDSYLWTNMIKTTCDSVNGARRSKNLLDQWQSGKLNTGSRVQAFPRALRSHSMLLDLYIQSGKVKTLAPSTNPATQEWVACVSAEALVLEITLLTSFVEFCV